ncbi:MAG: hypothetical protein Q8Q18_00120 [bacterium]|nr:hypothetical protein [bacterium]
MSHTTTILLVGGKNDTREIAGLLSREGYKIELEHETRMAYEVAKKMRPDAIAILVPQYWSSVGFLIQDIRNDEAIKNTTIYYMGELIEGGDLKILRAQDVRIISVGPVPFTEVVRQITAELPH